VANHSNARIESKKVFEPSDKPMSEIPFHPLADIFPLIEGEEFNDLVEDIKANGLHEPIVVYEDQILDGRNRYRACLEAGVEPLISNFEHMRPTREGISPESVVVSQNLHRRHLTAKEKRKAIADLLKAQPEKSDRQIAKTAKVDDKTVGSVRRELEGRAEIPHVDQRADTKGRKQPAAKAKAKPDPRATLDEERDPENFEQRELPIDDPEASAEARKALYAETEGAAIEGADDGKATTGTATILGCTECMREKRDPYPLVEIADCGNLIFRCERHKLARSNSSSAPSGCAPRWSCSCASPSSNPSAAATSSKTPASRACTSFASGCRCYTATAGKAARQIPAWRSLGSCGSAGTEARPSCGASLGRTIATPASWKRFH
jgi:ParB-like chromosome segregation protein Spo0J